MQIKRPPGKTLAPFIEQFWLADMRNGKAKPAFRENVLPTGKTHIVFRLSGEALRIFDNESDLTGKEIGPVVVGGARPYFHTKEVSGHSYSIGAIFKTGMAESLFGFSAEELAGKHTRLDDIWGRFAIETLERIAETENASEKFCILESFLASKLRANPQLNPVISAAAARLERLESVGRVAAQSGYSHRHFSKLFARKSGLHPKAFHRIMRFQKTLRITAETQIPLADIAFEAGYSDQAHFSRDFREFAGVSPARYRKIAPASLNHLEIGPIRQNNQVNFLRDKARKLE